MIIGSRSVLKTDGRDERLGGSSPSISTLSLTYLGKRYVHLLLVEVSRSLLLVFLDNIFEDKLSEKER